ncbi:MAG: MBL fold metallo-hydrolase [Leptolyngbyaceae cyanobacterium]
MPDIPQPLKSPRLVLQAEAPTPKIYAFLPNRATLGGTAYLIQDSHGNCLVDCPAWDEATQHFLQCQGGVRWLFITHRGAIDQVTAIHQAFGCTVIIQEQEAYLLPGLEVATFQDEWPFASPYRAIWTPGHSPGSACLYYAHLGGVLFSGRHLLPHPDGQTRPLRSAKTFHWGRQLQSVEKLRECFNCETLQFICPGANTGFLRGQYAVKDAYSVLSQPGEA